LSFKLVGCQFIAGVEIDFFVNYNISPAYLCCEKNFYSFT
jgi:hypothetical protein